MRRCFLGPQVVLLACLAASAAGAQPSPMFANAKSCALGGVPMNCVLWEPSGYDPAKRYPLIVYLHGAGQSGYSSNPAENAAIIENAGNWAAMLLAVVNEETGKTNGDYLVMMPQATDHETTPPNGGAYVHWDWGQTASYRLATTPESPSLKNARAMLEGVRASHSVDADRIYAIGASMGGFGAWDLIARNPQLFAAGLPNAGGGPPDAAAGLRAMAIWAHHNDRDGAVPSASDREMFHAVALAGGRPLYTESVSSDHTDWGVSGNPNFFPWMLAQRRGVPATSNPALAFDPPGGKLNSPVTVTISSDQGSNIKYTLDGSVPSSTNGTAYQGPVTLTDSAILIAMVDSGDQKVFHAAPFQVDGKPLPEGAEIVDTPPPPLPEPGGSGGASAEGSGGAPAVGAGGAAVAPTPGAGGAPGSSEPTPGPSPTVGPVAGEQPPSGSPTASGGPPATRKASGCAFSPRTVGMGGGLSVLLLAAAAQLRRRRG